ncbi:oxidoreductase-like protein [Rubrobacter xylanophilus DSM 9941]|uniref:Oxidoreductase-like protein n=1 Tax=Rubrobacter xylanophilus (strain DSM 9941 / JCM 11954 / NBRC 16129 / PRD-1) TaxID=266117 RepID=Q1AV91_RUBXD|nr:Gfo/Idh/MocA family oxidoreductase [Rubrobacter xylanophilus]ABG04687.1 oxidoreductase-like protein [Rubrobacter xylanophilus DSM 9941]
MRVGLIGAGRIGAIHARTLAEHPEVESLLVADYDAGLAEKLAARHSAEAVPSVEDIFEMADAVVIASPTDTHVEYLLRAAESGLPAFCEKPIAIDLESTDRAISAINEAGIAVQMGFMRRFDPGYRVAHELVASGELGEVTLVTGHTHDIEPPHESYIPRSGGAFKDMLIHDIDALRFVTGAEPVEVNATGSNRAMEVFERYGDLATVAAVMHLDDGSLAVLSGTRQDPLGYDVRMEVFGTKDSVAVGLNSRTPIRSVEPDAPPRDGAAKVGWLERFEPAYRAEMDAFVEVALGRRSSPCTPEDARAALVVAEACGASARGGVPVRVEEYR